MESEYCKTANVPFFYLNERNYRSAHLNLVGKLLNALLGENINLQLEILIEGSCRGFVKGRSCLTNFLDFFLKR